MNFLNSLDTALGPMGWIAILGALGLTMVGATLVMILRQPEDPLAKLGSFTLPRWRLVLPGW